MGLQERTWSAERGGTWQREEAWSGEARARSGGGARVWGRDRVSGMQSGSQGESEWEGPGVTARGGTQRAEPGFSGMAVQAGLELLQGS